MKRMASLGLFLSLFIFSLWAQAPETYYESAYGKSSYELKTALYTIIKDHKVRSYSQLWTDFTSTDKTADGKVWDMYSNCDFTFSTEQCGNYQKECDCYNREHSFPKSWFNDASPMYSDLFHLFPTDGKVNGMRSNFPFGRVGNATYTYDGCKLGASNYPGYSGTVFEPKDTYKGDFARAYFYMATRYQNLIASWNSQMLNGTSEQAFTEWAKNLLLEWHKADPVSKKETDRNNAVYKLQGNRNPFIDYPELVEKIWGKDNIPFDKDNTPSEEKTIQIVYELIDSKGNTIRIDSTKLNEQGGQTSIQNMGQNMGSEQQNKRGQTLEQTGSDLD